MKLFIKDMYNAHCRLVEQKLQELGIRYGDIKYGVVELKQDLYPDQKEKLNNALSESGMAIVADKKSILIERIKMLILEMIYENDELPEQKYSHFIGDHLGFNYTYLANLFSDHEGITIEHFIIRHKIEKAKQLLLTGQYNLSQVADRLCYSSVAHLSNQFKKVTGYTASEFKLRHQPKNP